MWSRGIAAVALCFVVATATLTGLPGPAPALPASPSPKQASEQNGLMTALAQAPAAVAAWKRLHGGSEAGTGGGTMEKSSAGQDTAGAAGDGQAGATTVSTRKTPAAMVGRRQPRPPVLRRGGSRS